MTGTQDFLAEISRRDGTVAVFVSGEIDMASAPEFRGALDDAIAVSDRLEVDLSATTFMDSSGLAVLLDAHQQLTGQGAFVLRDPSPAVRRLLHVAALETVLDVRDSTEPAEPVSRKWVEPWPPARQRQGIQ